MYLYINNNKLIFIIKKPLSYCPKVLIQIIYQLYLTKTKKWILLFIITKQQAPLH